MVSPFSQTVAQRLANANEVVGVKLLDANAKPIYAYGVD